MKSKQALLKAIDICGLKPLALALDVSYQAVQKYLKTQLPSEKVIPVAEATGWLVTPHTLRPDLYPHPDDGLPDHLRLSSKAA